MADIFNGYTDLWIHGNAIQYTPWPNTIGLRVDYLPNGCRISTETRPEARTKVYLPIPTISRVSGALTYFSFLDLKYRTTPGAEISALQVIQNDDTDFPLQQLNLPLDGDFLEGPAMYGFNRWNLSSGGNPQIGSVDSNLGICLVFELHFFEGPEDFRYVQIGGAGVSFNHKKFEYE